MKVKTLFTTAVAAITVGAAAIAGAQEIQPAADSPIVLEQRGQFGSGEQRGGLFDGEAMALLEAYTGLEGRELAEAVRGGQTLAGLIEANGEDVDAFITEAVALAEVRIDEALENERITEARAEELRANLVDQITERVNSERPPAGINRPQRGRGARNGLLSDLAVVDLAETYTGLEGAEIAQAVRDGETLASLIEANGGDVDAFVDEATTLIDERLQARADTMSENLRDRIEAAVNGEAPGNQE